MKKIALLIFVLFFISCGSSNNDIQSVKKELLISAYFYDENLWGQLENLKRGIIIVNPNNGPGDTIDTNYVQRIDTLNKNSQIPIGYVYTKWGARDLNEVKNDINKWLDMYNIKGFFIDEAANNEGNLSYYKNLYEYIKSKGDYLVVLNPGCKTNDKYYNYADVIVIFEDKFKNLNSDVCNKMQKNSAIIVYDANKSDMEQAMRIKCKYIYVTDDNGVNPYDSLPSYITEEINLLK